jgi:hypothetical protein
VITELRKPTLLGADETMGGHTHGFVFGHRRERTTYQDGSMRILPKKQESAL